jgi:carboxyl-terminal processing protease
MLPTVISEMIMGPDKKPTGIARIELTQFNQLAHQELDAALDKMQQKGMKGLIFDLRNNPGGLLTEAVAVGSRFIESGPIVLIKRGGDLKPMLAERTRHRYKGPLVVLVNKFSASASEIVAGAIKDTNRGVLVGTDTWGKGLVQTITPIREDGSAVLITTHRYLTPNKIDINKKGIAPLYKVTLTREDVEKKRDPQLDKAVAILKGDLSGKDATAQAPK